MKFDSYPRFIRSEHYRRLVQLELTNNFVTEHDITNAYKKGGPTDTQEDKKKKKTAFKLLKNAVNPIVSLSCIFKAKFILATSTTEWRYEKSKNINRIRTNVLYSL